MQAKPHMKFSNRCAILGANQRRRYIPLNTLEAILTRRNCRKFTDKPIESETLHQLLEAAMSGPSCVNAKDWSFVVVTDPEKLAQMADANGRPAEPLRHAAAGILVCGDLDRAFRLA